MSDVTPKKRPQRPAAPLWAARRRLRSETSEARGSSDSEGRSSALPPEPSGPPLPAPPRAPRPGVPRPAEGPPSDGAIDPPTASSEAVSAERAGITIRPGSSAPPEPAHSSEEPESVSLREIETLLSPGKSPPRLPATSARLVQSRAGGMPLSKPITRSAPPRPASMEPAPPRTFSEPPLTAERSFPSPLESSAADLELMAAIAAVPSKKPTDSKPPWAPPKPAVQAKAQTVAVLSSEATAALKGAKPAASAPPAGSWRSGSSSGATSATRTTTLRSPAAPNERPAAKPSVVVVPPPPVKVGPAKRPSVPDASAVDDAWDAPDAEPAQEPRVEANIEPAPITPEAMEIARVVDSLTMQGGPRGSLPDPVELLRDATSATKPVVNAQGRGSVVDPLELYGAVTPAPSRPPEQSLPKVMVQIPAKSSQEPRGFSDSKLSASAVTAASARTAAAIADAEAKSRAALAAAEAKAAAATVEATSAPKPKVDLPPRVEPRPFPKPPPRRVGATETGEHAKVTPAIAASIADKHAGHEKTPAPQKSAASKVETKQQAKPIIRVPPLPVPHKPLSPEAIWDVGPLNDDLGEDEIQVDMTPDPPEEGAAARPNTAAPPSSDSGRFDLHQLMATGPRSSKKGLADSDLLSLAGDLFHDTGPGLLAPPDLSALPKRGMSTPPPTAPLLAPVALATSTKAVPAASTRAAISATDRGSRLRAYAPWVLLPVVALGVAAIMIWRGPSADPDRVASTTSTAVTNGNDVPPRVPATEPRGDTTSPQPATTTTSTTSETKSATESKSASEPSGAQGAWKPPTSTTTAASAPTSTTSAPATTASAPATTSTSTKTATVETPPAGGNDFNTSAAKASLRNAAGAAAGCPADKPGVATVSITFAPSGRVTSSVVSGSFAGTTTGGCIAAAMRAASVPPFDGGPVSVVWKVTLR